MARRSLMYRVNREERDNSLMYRINRRPRDDVSGNESNDDRKTQSHVTNTRTNTRRTNTRRRHTYQPAATSRLYVGKKLIKAIYEPDEAAFDKYIKTLTSLEKALGFGRGKWTALMFAVHKRRNNMVRKLLDKGADPNCIDWSTMKSCLHSACSLGDDQIVSMLLSTRRIQDINYAVCADKSGEAAIHTAVKKCHSECVRMLLDISMHAQICDINLQLLSNGQSPLFMACDRGDVEIVKLLIGYKEMKCDLNAVDNKGYTPLMKAVGRGHDDVVRLLLDPNQNPLGTPDLTMVNQRNQCAAMLALSTANYEVTQLLLEHPDNEGVLFRRDWKGQSVFDLVRKSMQCEIKQHQKRKKSTEMIKGMLWKTVSVALLDMGYSKDYEAVPHLPDCIVSTISAMTY